MQLLLQSIQDGFRREFLKFILLPFIVASVVSYLAIFLGLDSALDSLNAYIHTEQTVVHNGTIQSKSEDIMIEGANEVSFFTKLLATIASSSFFSFMLFGIGAFFALFISIFLTVIIIGFLTPYILKELQKIYYHDVEMIGFGGVFDSLIVTLKYAAIMILLFILFIPLYFIPVVGVVALNFPLFYFFHKMMHYDIASNICTKEEFAIIKQRYAVELRIKSLLLYLFSMLPFVILFASVFYVIYLGHTYFQKVRSIRH